jgi:hypothetical protein
MVRMELPTVRRAVLGFQEVPAAMGGKEGREPRVLEQLVVLEVLVSPQK